MANDSKLRLNHSETTDPFRNRREIGSYLQSMLCEFMQHRCRVLGKSVESGEMLELNEFCRFLADSMSNEQLKTDHAKCLVNMLNLLFGSEHHTYFIAPDGAIDWESRTYPSTIDTV